MSPSAYPRSTLQKFIFFSRIWTPLESSFLQHFGCDRCIVKFLFFHYSKLVESFIFNVCCRHTMENMFEQFCAQRNLRRVHATYVVLCIKEFLIVVLSLDFHGSNIKTDRLSPLKVNFSMQGWHNFFWGDQIVCLLDLSVSL